jgi:hypothetical protein
MIRDPFYRDILARLGGRLDEDAFEACACDLLRREFPTLVPIPGGSDCGMDGATAGSGPFLVATTSPDVIRNLTRSLKSYLKNGGLRRTVVVAASQELTKKKLDNLEARARELGFCLIHIYSQASIADRLYYVPRWCKELLALTGQPSALTLIPKSDRPLVDSRLVGRDPDLAWLKQSSGDRLVIGSPGSGKTFLLLSLTKEGLALFLVDTDKTAIAHAIRSQQPNAIIVDDAHLDPAVISILRQLRQEVGADFDIIATGWAGDKDTLAVALNLPETQIHEIELLTRDEIVDVIKNAGLSGPRELIREIVDQSEGRPGLAVTLTLLCRTGGVRDVVFGEAISRELSVAFGRLVGERAKTTLGVFSLGGDAGLDIETVSEFCGFSPGDLQRILSRLAAGGVVREAAQGKVSVWPRTLRYILIRDTFFSSTPLDVRRLIDKVPSKTETATALIGARARGANIPWLTEFLKQVDSPQAWRHFASLGKDEATFVLRLNPHLISTISHEALALAPDEAIPLLLDNSVGDNRPLHSSLDHALRLIQDWIVGSRPGTAPALERRKSLLEATRMWLKKGGDEKTATRALVMAGSPKFERHSSDAGSGATITISRGLLTAPEIIQLRNIWKSIGELIARMKSPDWVAIFRAVREWAYPYVSSNVSPGESQSLFDLVTTEIVTHLSTISKERPGVQQQLREYGQRLGINLDTTCHEEFEVLFPTANYRSVEELISSSEQHDRVVSALASKWRDCDAKSVASRLRYLELEAALVSETRPRLTSGLCYSLAEGSDSCVEWVNEFIDQGLPSDSVFPFLHRAVYSQEVGWEEVAYRCLNSDNYVDVGISVLITMINAPDELITLVDEKVAAFDQLVLVKSLRGEIPEEMLRRLLCSKATNVASAAAQGEWNHDSPGFRHSLAHECRAAVIRAAALIRAEGEDYWLREIFRQDTELAYEWLIARIEAKHLYTSKELVQDVIDVLDFDAKLSVLDQLSLDPSSADGDLVTALVTSDFRLFKILLTRAHMRNLHLVSLAGSPTGAWCEMAAIALDAGYTPNAITNATFGWGDVWEGDESVMWASRIRDFEALLSHEDSRLHSVANAGIKLARERQLQAATGERREKVYGR